MPILFLVCFLLSTHQHSASGGSTDAVDIKAAFIYNFLKFVQWEVDTFPADTSPVRVCVVGNDPIYESLEKSVRGKTNRGRRIIVTRLHSAGGAGDACHMLFIGSDNSSVIRKALDQVDGTPVLTVGDASGFGRLGGMIGLTAKERRIGFEVNVAAVRRAGLKMSSKLLSLAKVIDE